MNNPTYLETQGCSGRPKIRFSLLILKRTLLGRPEYVTGDLPGTVFDCDRIAFSFSSPGHVMLLSGFGFFVYVMQTLTAPMNTNHKDST